MLSYEIDTFIIISFTPWNKREIGVQPTGRCFILLWSQIEVSSSNIWPPYNEGENVKI